MFNQKKPKVFKKFKTAAEKKTKTGTSLRNYCFWLLARRDYGREELLKKLNTYALDEQESIRLVESLIENGYVNDERVAGSLIRMELNKGSGLRRIQAKFKERGIDASLIDNEIDEVDWFQQAYELKVKRFGESVEKDQKLRNRQIRFLQSRGYELSVIFKVVGHSPDDCFD